VLHKETEGCGSGQVWENYYLVVVLALISKTGMQSFQKNKQTNKPNQTKPNQTKPLIKESSLAEETVDFINSAEKSEL